MYPLVLDHVTEDDVKRFWAGQPFDLGISHDLGNCDLCFMKGRWKLMRLITQYPERADWWIEQERYRRSVARVVRKPELTRFLMRYTYEDLRAMRMMLLTSSSRTATRTRACRASAETDLSGD